MIRTTWELRSELQIFAPNVAAHLAGYIAGEWQAIIQPTDLREEILSESYTHRRMLSPVHSGKPGEMNEEEMYGRFLLSLVDYSDKGGDFSDTIHELREFIRNNFTIDELSTLKSKLDFVVPMPIK